MRKNGGSGMGGDVQEIRRMRRCRLWTALNVHTRDLREGRNQGAVSDEGLEMGWI